MNNNKSGYVPVTLLEGDIRDPVNQQFRIVATYRRIMGEDASRSDPLIILDRTAEFLQLTDDLMCSRGIFVGESDKNKRGISVIGCNHDISSLFIFPYENCNY